MIKVRYKFQLIAAIAAITIFSFFTPSIQNKPQIFELKKVNSPDGVWTARYINALTEAGYGGSDLVSQVEIVPVDGKNKSIVVYTISSSGISDANINWKSNTDLIIEDNGHNIEFASKTPHPIINIQYKKY